MEEKITYEKYMECMIVVYKYLENKYSEYSDMSDIHRNNAEINLLTALAHPYLYLEENIKRSSSPQS